jgi:hypothetical protein
MKGAYQMFPLGLRLSHRALQRNLGQFSRLSRSTSGLVLTRAEGTRPVTREQVAGYVAWYVDFLDVHHRGEDDHLFPALRKHSAGRTTDAAHLDGWTREHQEIYRLGERLRGASESLGRDTPGALENLQSVSTELSTLLEPHMKAEEALLTPEHLPEMIPEQELERAQLAIPRSQGAGALRMASFFVHSLEPEEQRSLLGETPWVFRKLVLPAAGLGRVRRYKAIMPVTRIAL